MDYNKIKDLDIFELTEIDSLMRYADILYLSRGYNFPAQELIARYIGFKVFCYFLESETATICN